MVKTVTAVNFEETVNCGKTVLLDFWATWCGPCQMQGPIIDKVAEEMPDVVFGKVNVDEEMSLALKFNVMSIPTLLVFKNGQLANQVVGLQGEAGVKALVQ